MVDDAEEVAASPVAKVDAVRATDAPPATLPAVVEPEVTDAVAPAKVTTRAELVAIADPVNAEPDAAEVPVARPVEAA